MSSPVFVVGARLPAMSKGAIDQVRSLERALLNIPQSEIFTDHVIHGGLYARTITIPAGCALTGALIKIPTTLVLNGHVTVFTGNDSVELAGHHVIPASAGRKQAFLAHADTTLTMVFATSAKTVEQAEDEFTDEAHLLGSRHGSPNSITITGE